MSKSGRTEEDYRMDTAKYMVTEPGKLPYDSRLTEDTFVPDNYVPKKEKIQFVEIHKKPTNTESNSYETDLLDHEWQQKWFSSHRWNCRPRFGRQ